MTIEPTVSDAETRALIESTIKGFSWPYTFVAQNAKVEEERANKRARSVATEVVAKLLAAAARSAIPETEAVAWRYRVKVGVDLEWRDWTTVDVDPNDWTWPKHWTDFECQPLYTHPDLPDREGFAAGIEAAAKLIDAGQIVDSNDGQSVEPRSDGNRAGLAYAAAIRGLATGEREP